MNSDDYTHCLQPEDESDEFLFKDARAQNKDPVVNWGPKDDMNNFLQQTVNCLDACEMAINCGFSGMSSRWMQANWEEITTSHGNNRALNSSFVYTQDCKIQAKSIENYDLTSQQFWMFRRIDRQEIYVVFSTQETSAYILSDSDVWMMPRQKGIASVDNIPISLFKGLILQGYHLVFTGHSLGGAIAILTTQKLLMKDLDVVLIDKIRCITFGSPQISYQNLGQLFKLNKIIFKYELPEDPVPQLLTAFQNAENHTQEFLVNLMSLLGIQNSFKQSKNIQLGLVDFIELKDQVEETKKTTNFGTVFVPRDKPIKSKPDNFKQYYMEYSRGWSFLENQQEQKLFLSEFIEKLSEHQFKRYKEEVLRNRIQRLTLSKVDKELIQGDMSLCRIPKSEEWLGTGDGPDQIKATFDYYPNQIKATFDEKFTKIIITSKHPHVLGIRYGEVQLYNNWGMAAAKVLQDWSNFKIMFVFYSAAEYKSLKKNSNIKITLYGCFETVSDIKVNAELCCDEDASEVRNYAYKNMYLQQLYTSAFQTCLFTGEGHNPMLQVKDLSECQKSNLLQEDRNALVEVLGSLIVNQECLKIILEENKFQFQTILSKYKKFKACDTKILKDVEAKEEDLKAEDKKKKDQQTLIDLAKKELYKIYHKFKFDLKQQSQNLGEVTDAKECVSESIPILFSLSSSFIWQMKMFLQTQAILYGVTGGMSAGGIAGYAAVATFTRLGLLTIAKVALGSALGALGPVAFVGVPLLSIGSFLLSTGIQFGMFFKNSEEMQKSYKSQLEDLLRRFGYETKKQELNLFSIAGLEKKLAELCQLSLQQQDRYNYDNSEEELNQKILEHVMQRDTSQERGANEETELQKLIQRKIEFLSEGIKNHKKTMKVAPSRGLSALLFFIWNNYRIRLHLSKTTRIGIMGAKNAGKSTLSKLLGCAIEKTGEEETTEDATLFQNIPTNRFCVIDFPHLNNIKANNTMKIFYSLSDITIIVMRAQDGAKEDQKNTEMGEIVKTMKTKYGQLGYENIDRRLPVLLLFNQVDKMIFNAKGEDQDDQTLKQKSQKLKSNIINTLKTQYGIDEEQVLYLFTCLEPELPKPSKGKVDECTLELANQLTTQQISIQEFMQKQNELSQFGKSADRKRLQDVTGCCFFNQEKDHQESPRSIVGTLVKMVLDLGDKEGADSISDFFMKQNP
eukprot:TRINITY_DN5546_c1_g1_i3.p1 TRINITY_DN5546_c1_g1~~TRINITY_DN5546_c1_g1_i3.p1  ORF type:complete len:1186 (-),score=131.74 TRINITY_DN5546_c1_g1_i3:362-3919(-)